MFAYRPTGPIHRFGKAASKRSTDGLEVAVMHFHAIELATETVDVLFDHIG
jgi:hypothetical protein